MYKYILKPIGQLFDEMMLQAGALVDWTLDQPLRPFVIGMMGLFLVFSGLLMGIHIRNHTGAHIPEPVRPISVRWLLIDDNSGHIMAVVHVPTQAPEGQFVASVPASIPAWPAKSP